MNRREEEHGGELLDCVSLRNEMKEVKLRDFEKKELQDQEERQEAGASTWQYLDAKRGQRSHGGNKKW